MINNIWAELSSICEKCYGRSSKVTAFSKGWSLVITTGYSGTLHGNGRQCCLRSPGWVSMELIKAWSTGLEQEDSLQPLLNIMDNGLLSMYSIYCIYGERYGRLTAGWSRIANSSRTCRQQTSPNRNSCGPTGEYFVKL